MPTWFGSALGAAGNFIGGLFGRKGQRDANRMNLQIAREQMAFQERMSNTAYQRAADDLEKAGLNRVLALGSGASTPSGALATMQNPEAALQRGMDQATSSAMQARHLAQQLRNMRAIENKTHADEDYVRAQEDVAAEDIQLKRQQKQESIARTAGLMTQARQNVANTALTMQGIPGAQAEANLWRMLNQGNVGELAKALGVAPAAARAALMAARMIRMGSK